MRLLAYSLALFCLCLVSAGCALFDKDKKNAPSGNGSSGNAPNAPKKDNDPLFGGGGGARANPQPDSVPATAFISGYVLNEANQNVDNAHILLAKLDDDSKTIPVDVLKGGFFRVEKLSQGQKYKLTAWARVGDRRLVTTAQTYAPNSSIVLRLVNEDHGGGEPAPPPGPPSKISPPAKTTGVDGDQEFAPSVGSIMVPTWGQAPYVGATATPFPKQTPATDQDDFQDLPNALIRIPPSIYPPSTAATPTPQNVEPLGSLAKATVNPRPPSWPPDLNLNGPTKKAANELRPQPILPPAPPLTAPPSNLEPPPPNLNFPALKDDALTAPLRDPNFGSAPAQVPSCQMNNGRLVNFALRDLNGEPWEFRRHKGKVVLLDFWFTTCSPCLQSIPKLRELRARYGNKLEIVGIACEANGSPEAQAQRVNKVCHDKYVNYRQLLWSGQNCPVVNEFQVDRFPTMVLLDDNGVVLRRFVGVLGRTQQDELERLIQKQLNLQP